MAYDWDAESRKLLTEGVPDLPFRLSRRRRFIPAAFDVDGDVAATLFVRRGVSGDPWLEAWALERRDGEWKVLGGGSGGGYDELFEPRDTIEGLVRRYGSGWTARDAGRPVPWRRRGISYTEMRLAPHVAAIGVGDRRIDVAAHGLAIVVWSSRRPPEATALSATGEELGAVPLGHRRGSP